MFLWFGDVPFETHPRVIVVHARRQHPEWSAAKVPQHQMTQRFIFLGMGKALTSRWVEFGRRKI